MSWASSHGLTKISVGSAHRGGGGGHTCIREEPDTFKSRHRILKELPLLNFSSLISEDLWDFPALPSDRSVFNNFAGEYKNTAIIGKS